MEPTPPPPPPPDPPPATPPAPPPRVLGVWDPDKNPLVTDTFALFEKPASPQPAGSWWSRNWKWFVPTGCCLTSLIVPLIFAVLFGVGIAGIFSAAFGAIKSSEPYKVAVARAKANEQVVSALGTPIKEEWLISGKVNVNGGSGEADLSIPISGPKGKGTIYAVATKSAGQWTYSKLEVKIDSTGETIDLGP